MVQTLVEKYTGMANKMGGDTSSSWHALDTLLQELKDAVEASFGHGRHERVYCRDQVLDCMPKTIPARALWSPSPPRSKPLNRNAAEFVPGQMLGGPVAPDGKEQLEPPVAMVFEEGGKSVEGGEEVADEKGDEVMEEKGEEVAGQGLAQPWSALGQRICPECGCLVEEDDSGPDQSICVDCRLAPPGEDDEEDSEPAQPTDSEPVERPVDRPPPQLRRAILAAMVPSERALLSTADIEEWEADSLIYTGTNGRKYKILLMHPPMQISLLTGTTRGVTRHPAPAPPGTPPWIAHILPGATYRYEAGYRDREILSVRNLGEVRRQVPYPEPISKALEALGQARKRVEYPETEGLLWPKE